MQYFGKPSVFGELWYAEADAPTGPWGPAVKVLSHDNYTFYNPRLHPEFTPADSPILIFEGTYTVQFADRPAPTPRYDYNQISLPPGPRQPRVGTGEWCEAITLGERTQMESTPRQISSDRLASPRDAKISGDPSEHAAGDGSTPGSRARLSAMFG